MLGYSTFDNYLKAKKAKAVKATTLEATKKDKPED